MHQVAFIERMSQTRVFRRTVGVSLVDLFPLSSLATKPQSDPRDSRVAAPACDATAETLHQVGTVSTVAVVSDVYLAATERAGMGSPYISREYNAFRTKRACVGPTLYI